MEKRVTKNWMLEIGCLLVKRVRTPARKGSGRADEKDVIQGWLWQMKASRHVLDQGAAVTSGEGPSSSRMVHTLCHKAESTHHTLLLLIPHLSLVWPITMHMIWIRTIARCLPLDEPATWLQLWLPSSQTNALAVEYVCWWGEGPIPSSASQLATVVVCGLDAQLFLTALPPGSSASRQFPNKQRASFLFRTFCLHGVFHPPTCWCLQRGTEMHRLGLISWVNRSLAGLSVGRAAFVVLAILPVPILSSHNQIRKMPVVMETYYLGKHFLTTFLASIIFRTRWIPVRGVHLFMPILLKSVHSNMLEGRPPGNCLPFIFLGLGGLDLI